MNVQQLFQRLSFGEFSNLSLGLDGAGDIIPAKQSMIIGFANEALTRIHSRFNLRQKDLIIEMIDGWTSYYLLNRFAQSNCNAHECDPLYIMDGADPFTEDVIKILNVKDHRNCELPLNDPDKYNSVFTPVYNMVQVNNPIEGYMLTVEYQANHPELQFGVKSAVIYLPDWLEGALTAYIAHRVYLGMNGPENQAIAQNHLAIYEAICSDSLDKGLITSTMSQQTNKFRQRGFV